MYSANADDHELTERTRGKNRDLIHGSMMARTPVSSGARRFSEGTCYVNVDLMIIRDQLYSLK